MMKTHQMLPGQIHFARVNYRLCRGFQCHIIFVANQTCLILGKVFKIPRDRKIRSAVVMAIFLLMKTWYNHRQWWIWTKLCLISMHTW